jgi:DNA invertase Pin-like site-specific DNA recombinase
MKQQSNATYQTIVDYKGTKVQGKITALYCRLSKEEEKRSESVSIENQRRILLKFCKDKGFANPRVFVDDGETGVFFDRPGLNEMLAEIRAGNVSTVIIKDQSRIGREVVEIGLLKRTFDEFNVRFMSAEDGLDTAQGFDIMSLLRDVFNEWMVADTSRKIRSVLKAKGESGEPLASMVPYGYMKNPENPKRWIIDEPSAKVIRQIFQLCMDGVGIAQIARQLREEKTETPTYRANAIGTRISKTPILDPYDWSTSSVGNILARREYLGHLINFKTYSKSYKNRKRIFNDPSEYFVFENTHEAIIEVDVFERVQQIRNTGKRRRNGSGRVSTLSGLVWCADCQSKLYFVSGACHRPQEDNYCCSGFRTKQKSCTSAHFIRRVVLEQIVLEHIRNVTTYALEHEVAFIQMLETQDNEQFQKELNADKKALNLAEKRIRELDNIIVKAFEKNATGVLSDDLFVKLSKEYESEQNDLKAKVNTLQEKFSRQVETRMNVDMFLNKVRKYTRMSELTTTMLNELVERIEVHARDKQYSKTVQQVDIYFNYVGSIAINAPPPPKSGEIPKKSAENS